LLFIQLVGGLLHTGFDHPPCLNVVLILEPIHLLLLLEFMPVLLVRLSYMAHKEIFFKMS